MLERRNGPYEEALATVAYDDGHDVGHYLRILRGDVYQVDLTVIG